MQFHDFFVCACPHFFVHNTMVVISVSILNEVVFNGCNYKIGAAEKAAIIFLIFHCFRRIANEVAFFIKMK